MPVTGNNIFFYNKSIFISKGGLSFCINGKHKRFVFDNDDCVFNRCLSICITEPLLQNIDDTVHIIIDSHISTLVPASILSAGSLAEDFLKFNFANIDDSYSVFTDKVKGSDIVNVFACKGNAVLKFKDIFSSVVFHHISTLYIEQTIKASKLNSTKLLWAYAQYNTLYLFLADNGKLILNNSFQVLSGTDILYYCARVFEEFNLSQKHSPLYLSGSNSAFELLSKHIAKTQYISECV